MFGIKLMRPVSLLTIVLFALAGCRRPYVQNSSAMEPTIHPNEVIQVQMDAYLACLPKRWDVVLFRPPKKSVLTGSSEHDLGVWVFRIVGIPGDTVSFDDTGLLLNGKSPLGRPPSMDKIRYLKTTESDLSERWCSPTYPITVPPNHYFVLGDNPEHANDSRSWGLLARENILGKVCKH